MLHLQVPSVMMIEKPANYTTYQDHLKHVQETKERIEKERKQRIENKKARRGPDRSRKFKMEVSVESFSKFGSMENESVDNESVQENMEEQTPNMT